MLEFGYNSILNYPRKAMVRYALEGPWKCYALCMSQRAPISISVVCVYNDPAVRQDCLDRSLEKYIDTGNTDLPIEYISVDNTNGEHKSAGAALNYGASEAKNDILVFVHQDVFFHSIEAVLQAAQEMERGHFGVLGAIGVRSDGRVVGSVRDRTVLGGDPVAEPIDVDSVDELLFMVPRQLVMSEPLTESPDMAWHAYAVEYGLRVRKLGLRVGVAHIPVTHNSLTKNFARLDVAHARVAARYRDMLPIHTTCGVLTRKMVNGRRSWLASLSYRYRRIATPLAAARRLHRYSNAPIVYADIRSEIDEFIGQAPGQRIYVINNTSGKRFADDGSLLELKRLGMSVFLIARELKELSLTADQYPQDAWLLITNMAPQDIREVEQGFVQRDRIIAFDTNIGYWMIVGAGLADLPTSLRQRLLPLHRYLRSSWPLAGQGEA